MKKVSVVIPAFNEEDCVNELVARLRNVFLREPNYIWDLLIVENGSEDRTYQALIFLRNSEPRLRILKLSRNFRMDGGITAGLSHIDSDACVIMTADLQDPPEVISQFLRKWEEGYENIYALVNERQGISPIRRFNSVMFYRVASFLSDGLITKNASDFRLVDRKVYESVREMTERNRFVRGLFSWVGFKSVGVEINRPPRFAGVSNADTFKVLDLAAKGIMAHSNKPLRFISAMGFFVSLIALASLLPFAWLWFTSGVPFAGFGTIVSLIILGLGSQVFFTGVMSEYLGMVYEEVKKRPNFIVSEIVE
jgi:glycosyltransferase involved in cell wall biosynthesis